MPCKKTKKNKVTVDLKELSKDMDKWAKEQAKQAKKWY